MNTKTDIVAVASRVATAWQSETVDGFELDANTASLIVEVYDALSSEKAAAFRTWPIEKAAAFAWSVVS